MNGISIRILEVCREKHSCFFRPLKHLMTELSYDMLLLLPFAETGWEKTRLFIGSRRSGKKSSLTHIKVSGIEGD